MILDLFPQPISIVDSTVSWDYDTMITAAEQWLEPHALVQSGRSSYNRRRQILELPQFLQLNQWIHQQVEQYLQLVGSVSKVTVINSWVNHQPQGSAVDRHCHQLSRVSGVFYLRTEPLSSALTVYNNQKQFQGYDFVDRVTDYNRASQDIPVQQGRLILFPGWMEHSVAVTAEPRWAVSFNTVFV